MQRRETLRLERVEAQRVAERERREAQELRMVQTATDAEIVQHIVQTADAGRQISQLIVAEYGRRAPGESGLLAGLQRYNAAHEAVELSPNSDTRQLDRALVQEHRAALLHRMSGAELGAAQRFDPEFRPKGLSWMGGRVSFTFFVLSPFGRGAAAWPEGVRLMLTGSLGVLGKVEVEGGRGSAGAGVQFLPAVQFSWLGGEQGSKAGAQEGQEDCIMEARVELPEPPQLAPAGGGYGYGGYGGGGGGGYHAQPRQWFRWYPVLVQGEHYVNNLQTRTGRKDGAPRRAAPRSRAPSPPRTVARTQTKLAPAARAAPAPAPARGAPWLIAEALSRVAQWPARRAARWWSTCTLSTPRCRRASWSMCGCAACRTRRRTSACCATAGAACASWRAAASTTSSSWRTRLRRAPASRGCSRTRATSA